MNLETQPITHPAPATVRDGDTATLGKSAGMVRLDYVDSLRALAALGVVILHVFQINGFGLGNVTLPGATDAVTSGALGRMIAIFFDKIVELFHYGVQVFIVLSGYSLMLPVARRGEGRLSVDALTFFKHRARRILPPYYGAVVFALLATALVPGMNVKSSSFWDLALPAFSMGALVSHGLLLQNLYGQFVTNGQFTINPPLWTIAVEWQIYFLFPLMVVLWRRWGIARLALAALALGFVQLVLFVPTSLAYPFSHWWFIGLFVLGMAAASVGFSANPRERMWRERLPWPLLTVVFGALFMGAKLAGAGATTTEMPGLLMTITADSLIGMAMACLLMTLSRQAQAPSPYLGWLSAVLHTPVLTGVGVFSYSLYLIHAPVLVMVFLAGKSLNLAPQAALAFTLVPGVLIAILVSYLFHLAVERPFMSKPARPVPTPPTVIAQ